MMDDDLDLFPDLEPNEKPCEGLWGAKRAHMFDGATYEPEHDEVRLSGALMAVYDVLQDGKWWTLDQIRESIRFHHGKVYSEAGVSARLRDLRKAKFGGHTIEHRRIEPAVRGLWEYRLMQSDEEKV